jgi:hypothetical protein
VTSSGITSVVDWLTDGARSAQRPEAVLAELCDRLVQADISLWRVSVFVRTLHPEIVGRRFISQRGAGVTITNFAHQELDLPIARGDRNLRLGLTHADAPADGSRAALPLLTQNSESQRNP